MRKLIAAGSSFLFFIFSFFAITSPVFAQTNVNPCVRGGGVGFGTLCNFTLSGGFIGKLVTLAFILAVLIALAFLIFGGIRWILSGGDKTKVEEARGTIVASVVGLILVFLAFFIINFLFTFFGLESIRNLSIPSLSGGGGGGGLTNGSACTDHSQCRSGFCMPTGRPVGTCASR